MPYFRTPARRRAGPVAATILLITAGLAPAAHAENPAPGTPYGWGLNSPGQLGNPADGTFAYLPSGVYGLPGGVLDIAAGDLHTVALLEDGSVWTWGGDDTGQLGNDPASTTATSPVKVPGISDAIAVAAGPKHSLAL